VYDAMDHIRLYGVQHSNFEFLDQSLTGKRRLLPAATQADLVLFGVYSYQWRPYSSGRNYFHDGVRCRSHGKPVGCAFPLFRFSNDSGVEQLFFLYGTASVLVAGQIAPALSSILMKNGLWSPIILGAVIEGFSIVIALSIPGTFHLRNAKFLESSEMEEQRSMDMTHNACRSKKDMALRPRCRDFETRCNF